MPRFRVLVVVAAAATALLGHTASAAAQPSSTQPAVAAYLAAHPGGRQISPSDIAYANGAFIVTVVRAAGAKAAADCPRNWFCFYDRVNFGYPRGRLSSCGWQDLGKYGWQNRTEAVHVNLPSKVSFLYHGSAADHSADSTAFSIGPFKSDSDVGSARNRTDHVYRFC
jgi:hypothetical protein